MCFSGLFFYSLLFLLDFFHIAPEGRAADAQLTGSGGAISAVGGDGLLDDIADDLFEGLLTGLAGRNRHRLSLDDGAGEDEPHPAGKTGFFNGGKKL